MEDQFCCPGKSLTHWVLQIFLLTTTGTYLSTTAWVLCNVFNVIIMLLQSKLYFYITLCWYQLCYISMVHKKFLLGFLTFWETDLHTSKRCHVSALMWTLLMNILVQYLLMAVQYGLVHQFRHLFACWNHMYFNTVKHHPRSNEYSKSLSWDQNPSAWHKNQCSVSKKGDELHVKTVNWVG